jgi:hypothetical protein
MVDRAADNSMADEEPYDPASEYYSKQGQQRPNSEHNSEIVSSHNNAESL